MLLKILWSFGHHLKGKGDQRDIAKLLIEVKFGHVSIRRGVRDNFVGKKLALGP